MTARNLFNIVLKILGIFFIRDIFLTLPALLSQVIVWNRPDSGDGAFTMFGLTILLLLIEVFLVYSLIFKTELLIDMMKLDKDFSNEIIPFQIHRSTVLSISIIVLGGCILVQEIPIFFRELYSYYQQRKLSFGQDTPTLPYFILSIVKIVIGLVLIGNQQMIVNLIERKRKK